MSVNFNDASFWDRVTEYQTTAHDFTAHYAERAWQQAALPAGAPAGIKVLDIAAGAGALSLVAARAGAQVVATDFSAAMVASMLSHRLANLDARVMDGQALEFPDASFDAAFSMFGIMLFPDWRKGLAEMARVVKPGGVGCVGTWRHPDGAAANLLLANCVTRLFPDLEHPTPIEGMNHMRDPDRFQATMTQAGFGDVSIVELSNDYPVQQTALADPERLFQFSPLWPQLDARQRDAVLSSISSAVAARGGVLPVRSPALIATARRV